MMNTLDYITDKCRGCANFTGFTCLYDMKLEAEELGCNLEDICDDTRCDYFELPEEYND